MLHVTDTLFPYTTLFRSSGAVFFGLWRVPMGMLVRRSGWMPGLRGWTLVVGGGGYVVSAFAGLVPGLSTVSMVATLPATIGEFWMIGYLLVRGTRTERALPAGGG